jgi:hypothetical protein
MTLRDEFESWVNTNPGYTYFECYQAAHAKQQKRVRELERLLNDSCCPSHGEAYSEHCGWCVDTRRALSATAQEGDAPALDIEEFIAAKKYYTTIANPEEMDGTESVSVAELREFMHSQVATASPQAAVPDMVEMEPFQTVDKSSKNYKAGWNACRAAMLRHKERTE